MDGIVLVLNAGSSSVKFSAFEARGRKPRLTMHGQIEGLYTTTPRFAAGDADGEPLGRKVWNGEAGFGHRQAIEFVLWFLRGHYGTGQLIAVGHRVVHGGADFAQPALVTPALIGQLEKLTPLAPLHQPHNLEPIRMIAGLFPDLPQVACFDTAFHRTQPGVAQAFALPAELTGRGIQRYGFHGLSYEYIGSVLPDLAPRAAQGRTLVAHLGNGASMCALVDGESVASTMGFTAVDGLPMGTRCGNLDPGVVLHLMSEHNMDARAIEALLYKQSGLLGVSGVSSDVRVLLASDAPRARDAIDLLVYRIGREIGSLAAAMQGIDALVFTAGIGEHAPLIRERVCRAAAWLGLELDPAANERGDSRISTPESRVSAWVIPTDEELMIARHTLAAIGLAAPGSPGAPHLKTA
ncbi:MAG: acetate/propionate family kinase [Burkholderiaceae bacterium]|nr:acetate/propionate family kinase [Burkholderiaceae bacterium]